MLLLLYFTYLYRFFFNTSININVKLRGAFNFYGEIKTVLISINPLYSSTFHIFVELYRYILRWKHFL